ncbi:Lamin-like protein [Striga hermonthica]|uniref:Lamin-like protein n=1 Tax=Striga hermonthica TaxID=68872 RepID=A0A9N7R8E8_STRHE|nr:Lamin-like protein [Striga hermonthica]
MLGLRCGVGLAALVFAAAVLQEAAAVRYTVGNNGLGGWTIEAGNFSNWTIDKHFYRGDWLYFVSNRNLYQVLEVNSTTYNTCRFDQPLGNFTGGAGRDVMELNETREYYFISSEWQCLGGMKLMVHVENPPPPPSSQPSGSGSHSSLVSDFRARALVPALFAAAAFWDSVLLLL